MTDKQIIIDGVDVKDCKRRIGKDSFCRYYKRPCAENNYNCIWKKYLRKEQECEELKKGYSELTDIVSPYMDDFTGYNEELGGFDIVLCVKELMGQLKVENDKYSFFVDKLCEYAGLECDDEEQAMRTLSDLASQINKAVWIIDRYKQTLTEIKEIAEKIDDSDGCAYGDYDCNNCSSLEQETVCTYKVKKLILQKISECEGNNDMENN